MAQDHAAQPAQPDGETIAVEVFPTVIGRDERSTEPVEAVELLRTDVRAVHADTVTMEHSGVERIEAERVTVANSGVRAIQASSAQVANTGILTLTSSSTSVHQSSILQAATDTATVSMSAIFFLKARTATLDRSTTVVIGAGDGVRSIIDPKGALAIGLGIGAMVLGIGRLFRRRA